MSAIRSWIVAAYLFFKYLGFRAGLWPRPMITDHYADLYAFASHLLRWSWRLRLARAECCPESSPAVFAANHVLLTDPMYIFGAAARASRKRIYVHFMARDDFFTQWYWRLFPVRMDDLLEMTGAHLISRDKVRLSQLKPLLELLESNGSFLMFPGRSRSRTGVVMEYRDGFEEPGAVSFFLAQGGRRAGLEVPAVPVARTFNPVTGRSVVTFGAPMRLARDATRDEQRAFDAELAVRIGELIEVHTAHLVCGLIYLWCLHARGPAFTRASLTEACRALRDGLDGHAADPAMHTNLEREVARVLRFLHRKKLVRVDRERVYPDVDAVLAAPDWAGGYRQRNPLKFTVNQILHMTDVIAHIEEAAAQLAG